MLRVQIDFTVEIHICIFKDFFFYEIQLRFYLRFKNVD